LQLAVSIDAASQIRPRWPNSIDSPSAPWMRPGGLRCRWRKSTYYFSPLGPHPRTIVRLDEATSAPAVGLWGGSLRLPFIVRSLARLPRKCGVFACACVFADDTTGPCVRGPRKGQSLAAGAGQLHRVASMPAMLFGRLLVRWVRAMHGQICHRKPEVLLGYHHREQLLLAASVYE